MDSIHPPTNDYWGDNFGCILDVRRKRRCVFDLSYITSR
jgi:hypothetical protein